MVAAVAIARQLLAATVAAVAMVVSIIVIVVIAATAAIAPLHRAVLLLRPAAQLQHLLAAKPLQLAQLAPLLLLLLLQLPLKLLLQLLQLRLPSSYPITATLSSGWRDGEYTVFVLAA